MTDILVVAPHPDDETLGCGATLLRETEQGARVHWLIMTKMDLQLGFSEERIDSRQLEIKKLAEFMNFTSVHQLDFLTTRLDTLPLADIVSEVGKVISKINPHTVYLPHRGDVHSDHLVTFNACKACVKWFRYPTIKNVYCYETVSETDFAMVQQDIFIPNRFVDVSSYINRKMEALNIYGSEMGAFPFPRSSEAIRALAFMRGAQCGVEAAESFVTLREIVR